VVIFSAIGLSVVKTVADWH